MFSGLARKRLAGVLQEKLFQIKSLPSDGG